MQTLEAVLAAGQAILDTEKESEARAQRILDARSNAVKEVAMTAARGFLPAGVHAYMEARLTDNAGCRVAICIPDALPVYVFMGCGKVTSDDDPDLLIVKNWEVISNRWHEEVIIWRDDEHDHQLFSGSLEELPKALLIAKNAYRPPVVPEPIAEPTPSLYTSLYTSLRDDIENALQFSDPGNGLATIETHMQVVIAKALVDIAESLDAMYKNSAGV